MPTLQDAEATVLRQHGNAIPSGVTLWYRVSRNDIGNRRSLCLAVSRLSEKIRSRFMPCEPISVTENVMVRENRIRELGRITRLLSYYDISKVTKTPTFVPSEVAQASTEMAELRNRV